MMITIPIYDMIMLPGVSFYFRREVYDKWNEETAQIGEKVLFLLLKEEKRQEEICAEDFFRLGFSAEIVGIDGDGVVQVRILNRVSIDELSGEGEQFTATASVLPDVEDLSREEANRRFVRIREEYLSFIQGFPWGVWVKNTVQNWKTMNEMMCATAGYTNMDWEEKYAVMAEDSLEKRTALMEKAICEFMAGTRVSAEAQAAQKESHDQIYRETAIKKQIEYLQKELDEMHPENISDVRRFEKAIAESGMNEAARQEAEKVLNRMKQEGKDGHEYGMLYDYLDFVTGLSWKKEKASEPDLEKAEKVLDEDHYGMKKVKERMIQQMAVMALNKKQSGSILLFVGAPGTGKTSIGRSIAKALGRPYVRISLGGIRDEAEIRGHRRTYVGAMPGRIMEGIRRSGASNPVVVLDEVDKLVKEFSGDPASALLEVLDPEQNGTFTDHYMNVPYDLSDVLFLCTANTTDTIPEPLLNRMEEISFQGYTASEKFQIARKHLIPEIMEEMGLKPKNLKITDKALRKIIEEYTMESGVRSLKKQIAAVCRMAAVKLVKKEQKSLTVSEKKLEEYLGSAQTLHDKKLERAIPGIMTGLAWTSAGGDILFIESSLTEGEEELVITGQLGDVMKESVQIAVSVVKALYPREAEKLQGHKLHIHVPAGAVPKDGPSAGVTIVTALASLLTGKAVNTEYAMTGEISLRGRILPIGGLPEKLMAAQRAGIKKVFIPQENRRDLKEIPKEVIDKLEIVAVSQVEELMELVFV